MLHYGRPDRAGEIVAADADRHRNPATAREPQRNVGHQRRERGRGAQQPDQQSLGQVELPQAGGIAGRDKAGREPERADDDRDHHAIAVREAPHEYAAQAETDHGESVGQGRIRAVHAEIRLHARQHHGDRVHARAADGHQRERGA